MASFKIRSSKYRHIFADTPKPENTFTGFRLSTVTGDQQYIKASATYFALALSGGGGPVAVCRHDRPGRFEYGKSQIITGHKGNVLDFDWNPFDDSMLATASEDTTLKLWSIPDDWEPTDEKGNSKEGEHLTESLVDLEGHMKKVTLCRFNPTVNNCIASTSADLSVKVWDFEKGEQINSFDEIGDLSQDIVWDIRGDELAVSSKDKVVRFFDPRAGTVSKSIQGAHDGSKSVKLTYLGESGKFLTVGASKQSAREVKIWDLANLDKPLHVEKIDNAAGVIMPLYDNDTNVLYMCGKGDGNIRTYEFEDRAPYVFKLNDFRSTTSTKGCCMIPKRGNNVMAAETARLLKLTNGSGVLPLSFTVPRKADSFQADIFPPCAAPEAAHTVDEWLGGSSKLPITMSLDPAAGSQKRGEKKAFVAKTVASVSADLKEAQKRIKYLEGKLTENNIPF